MGGRGWDAFHSCSGRFVVAGANVFVANSSASSASALSVQLGICSCQCACAAFFWAVLAGGGGWAELACCGEDTFHSCSGRFVVAGASYFVANCSANSASALSVQLGTCSCQCACPMSFWAPLDRVALGREMAGPRRHCMVTVGTGLLLPRARTSVLCFQGLSLPWVRIGGPGRFWAKKTHRGWPIGVSPRAGLMWVV